MNDYDAEYDPMSASIRRLTKAVEERHRIALRGLRRDTPAGSVLTLGDILVWLDAVRRAYGDDIPLSFEGTLVADARLESRGDQRHIVLYARPKGWNV